MSHYIGTRKRYIATGTFMQDHNIVPSEEELGMIYKLQFIVTFVVAFDLC